MPQDKFVYKVADTSCRFITQSNGLSPLWEMVGCSTDILVTSSSLCEVCDTLYPDQTSGFRWGWNWMKCATGNPQIPKFLDFRIPSFQDPWFGFYPARSTHRQEFNLLVGLTLTNCNERCWRNLAPRAPVSTLTDKCGCTVVLFLVPCSWCTWHPMCTLCFIVLL